MPQSRPYTGVTEQKDVSQMSKGSNHLAIGGGLVALGTVLALTTKNVETPIVSLDKVGIVLIVLGAIEVLWTLKVMLFPSPNSRSQQ